MPDARLPYPLCAAAQRLAAALAALPADPFARDLADRLDLVRLAPNAEQPRLVRELLDLSDVAGALARPALPADAAATLEALLRAAYGIGPPGTPVPDRPTPNALLGGVGVRA